MLASSAPTAAEPSVLAERRRWRTPAHSPTLITGAGDTPAAVEDFEFAWPDDAFATAASTLKTGLSVLRPTLGAYQSAAATVVVPSYRILYASPGTSLGQQIGALVGPIGEHVEPFPPALDLESASAALEAYLG
jgi:hypothetical protein